MQHGRGGWEAEVEILLVLRGCQVLGRYGEGGLVPSVGLLGWREESRMWESGYGIFILVAEFSHLLRISRCGIMDQSAIALRGDALKGAINLLVE